MVMKKGFWIILCMFFIPLVTFAGNMKLHYDNKEKIASLADARPPISGRTHGKTPLWRSY